MIIQSFRMAFSSILSNKMRSFLTMLGIIIGVVAVVVLISLVSGATDSVTSEIEGLGGNLLTVNISSSRYQPLNMNEVDKLSTDYESIGSTAPTISKSAMAKAGNKTYTATILGTTPNYAHINNLNIGLGRFLKTPDVENNTTVATIGSDVAMELFGTQNVLGESLSVNGRSFSIVGVLEDEDSMIGGHNNNIIIPFTLAQRIFQQNGVTSFHVMASSRESVSQGEEDLETAMLRKFRQDKDAFSIINRASIMDVMDSVTGTLTLLLGGIAGISLLVGGIGIMNIMLVSVAERTKEIGIRKALGAGRKRILTQFLIESLVVSVLGGVIGILVSWGILQIVSNIASLKFGMSPNVVALAVGFSIFVGVIFGLYPANKASKLHPIDALRNE